MLLRIKNLDMDSLLDKEESLIEDKKRIFVVIPKSIFHW